MEHLESVLGVPCLGPGSGHGFKLNFFAFSFSCQCVGTIVLATLKTIAFGMFYRLLVTQEILWVYTCTLHTQQVTAGFSSQIFMSAF